MKRTKKESEKRDSKKEKKETVLKSKKQSREKIEDVQKLVHLLQVHQVELEHQNQELRITQEELEVSRNKYVNLFDFSPVPYFTLNYEGTIKEVNLRASSMLGIDRKKLIGRRFLSFVPVDELDIFNSFMKTVFTSDIKHTCELRILNKQKQTLRVLLEAIKLEDTLEEEMHCQIALIDLTENKKIEDSLLIANKELKSINNTKDKFFSIIAHDLRSPFQSLLMASELLAAEINTLSKEEIVLSIMGLNKNLINLHNLLDNLLNWSHMQRGMIEFEPVKINVLELVNRTIEISNNLAQKKKIEITNRVNPKLFVNADFQMLRSVIHNLLNNAIKFTKQGGQIVISSTEKKSFVEISVKDNGIGMTRDEFSNLFDFNSICSTNKGTDGEIGSGLGLHLCKEFIERNDGKIWVESELGKGSKFTFTLPKVMS